jgi:hypothetical protein
MEVNMSGRAMLACILALALTSCGSTKLSKSDISDVKMGEKAVINTYNQPLIGRIIFGEQPVTKILSVDGKKVDGEIFKLDEQIAVDVGIHKIEFSCSDRGGYNENDFTEIIQLDLKPHHEYSVRCSFDSAFGADGSYEGSFSVKEKNLE